MRNAIAEWVKKNKPKESVRKVDCQIPLTCLTCVAVLSSSLVFVADIAQGTIFQMEIEKVGLKKFNIPGCMPTSLCYSRNLLYMCDNNVGEGIICFNLENNESRNVLPDNNNVCAHGITLLSDDSIVYSDTMEKQIKHIGVDGKVTIVAGNGQTGMKFGPATHSEFTQPKALASMALSRVKCLAEPTS